MMRIAGHVLAIAVLTAVSQLGGIAWALGLLVWRRFARIFVDPLAKSVGVMNPQVGFQGCRAARHDDHVHVPL
jgi:hypothetical protein